MEQKNKASTTQSLAQLKDKKLEYYEGPFK